MEAHMLIGRIVGSITATRKTESLTGHKLLLIRPRSLNDSAHVMVAVDALGAGVGETVLIATGRAARIAAGREDLPVDATVIGIVDGEDLE
jgi:ethanolamine utilization protein EutN